MSLHSLDLAPPPPGGGRGLKRSGSTPSGRHFYGSVERGLDSGRRDFTGRYMRWPGHHHPGERLGDEKSVPRPELPGPIRKRVEASHPGSGWPGAAAVSFGIADRGADQVGQLRHAGLGHKDRAARAVRGDGARIACFVGKLHIAQPRRSAPRTRSTDWMEAEPLYRARNQFAVEAGADEHSQVAVAEPVSARQQRPVPQGEDHRRMQREDWGHTRFVAVFVSQSGAQQPNDQRRERWDQNQRDALSRTKLRRGGRTKLRRGLEGHRISLERFSPCLVETGNPRAFLQRISNVDANARSLPLPEPRRRENASYANDTCATM